MSAIISLQHKNVPVKLILITRLHSFGSVFSILAFMPATPAQFTKIDGVPKLFLTLSAAFFTDTSSDTSTFTDKEFFPNLF